MILAHGEKIWLPSRRAGIVTWLRGNVERAFAIRRHDNRWRA
jgi:hypothetical protein